MEHACVTRTDLDIGMALYAINCVALMIVQVLVYVIMVPVRVIRHTPAKRARSEYALGGQTLQTDAVAMVVVTKEYADAR